MKNIGAVVGLYPTPVTIVGTEIDGKVNWINIAHIGIWGVDKMLLSINKSHYTNKGLKENRTASINIVDEAMLIEADYVGIVSGKNIDKSNVFEYFTGELKGAPLIKKSPIAM
ncbi:MAG: flavin reductase family protein, partial [Brevinematales bacterium]